jgi:PAS domain S-box-containing protein
MNYKDLARNKLIIELQKLQRKYDLLKKAQLKKVPEKSENVVLNEDNEVLTRKIEDKTLQAESTEKELRKYADRLEKEILEYKRSEDSLRKSETYSRMLFDSSPVGLALCRMDGSLVDVNRAYANIIGRTIEETLKLTYWDITPEKYSAQEAEQLKILLETGHYGKYEKEYIHKDGHLVPVVLQGLFLDRDGERFIWSSVEDISERKRVESALHISQNMFQTLSEVSPVGIFRTTADGSTTYVNPKWSELSGLSFKEALGNGWLKAVHPDDREKLTSTWINDSKSEKESGAEYRFLRPDGSVVWVIGKAVPEITENEVIGYIGTITNITYRKIAEDQLKSSEEKYRRIFENVQDLYYETTMEGIILEVSPSIEVLSKGQYRPHDLIGKSMNEFYPDPHERARLISLLKERGSVTDFEITLRNRDGSSIPCSISSKIYLDAHGHPEKILGSARDITERKKFEEELITARVKAEESDNLKTAFIHNISHEIRTPMNAIIGFSALLTDPSLDNESKLSFIESITQSSNQLLAIIIDIIEISNIDAGILKYSKNEIKINSVLQRLFDQFLPKATQKGIIFRKETPLPDDKAVIVSDNNKFVQILSNLLSNAFKFTERGKIEFGYAVTDKFLNFYVSDTGIGIPEDQYKKVFDRFYQVEHIMARHFEGTGLGLSISKAFVELLGGKIWVDSKLGEGSVFYFSIPFNRSEAKIPDNKPTVQELSFNRKTTILIAEDDDNNFSLISKFLAIPNLTIIRAKNGLEAVKYCESVKDIALVLMDLKMPEMDGYEATARIKHLFPKLPVIAQTAFVTDKYKALECGCSEIITKPFRRKDLIEVLRKFLKS